MFYKYLGDSKMFEYDRYYRECQQQNKPFIKAKLNPVHSKHLVQVDLMTCSYKLSASQLKELKKLALKEIEYVNSERDYDFAGYNITSELSWFDGVSSEHVDEFCSGIYDLISKT